MRVAWSFCVLSVALLSCDEASTRPEFCNRDCLEIWEPACEQYCGMPRPAGCEGNACPIGGRDGGGAGGSGTGGSGGTGGDSGIGGGGSGGSAGTGGDGDAGPDGAMDADTGPEPCDETGTPKTESCLVSDAYAAFVAPSGSAGAAGTIDAPASTIAAGIAAAHDRDLPYVIVCGGDYTEALVITTGDVAVYGGFECARDEWRWDEDAVTRVSPSTGVALTIQDVTDQVVIEDVAFESADATAAGGSSIAAVVANSMDVVLRSVTLIAGAGADGQNASTMNYSFPSREIELDGNDASALIGGLRKIVSCPGDVASSGGKGGDGGAAPENGNDGTPNLGAGDGGTAGMSCGAGGTGLDGVPGEGGDNGAGATTLGAITSNTWQSAAGGAGDDGSPGQGGGGGAGTASGGGGGGGAGGCGGRGGASGQGGGASIALLSVRSTVRALSCAFMTRDAGDGGDGSTGQQGQQESGFPGLQTGNACSGGSGGYGGAGGAGGGGAGGIAVGILYVGEKPEIVDTNITTGDAGAPGQGGAPGTNDGVAGVAQDEFEAP
jgi:hypothetical protein